MNTPIRRDVALYRIRKCAAFQGKPTQSGVVLIIALILLIVISMFAVTSLRNAASTESVVGNVRMTELANQAAEIALRHCEASAIKVAKNNGGDTTSTEATYTTDFVNTKVSNANSLDWDATSDWDADTGSKNFLVPLTLVNTTTATASYKRAPECRVELLSSGTGSTAGSVIGETVAFVVTARAFGPEVAAGTGRPKGTEVWLQSTIEIQ